MSDVPTGLLFVDPAQATTFRFCLYAEPGEGKTQAAATAPAPMLVVNADRPTSWAVARRRNPGKDIRETRYLDHSTLDEAYRYAESTPELATVVIDPWSNVYDQLVATAPKKRDDKSGELKPDYEMVNAKLLQFVTRMRLLDVHLVIVAHEKENDGKKGDGKTYPRLGGMTLIRKLLAEMDVVGHVERTKPDADADAVWFAQIQPTGALIGKDGTDSLGERRVADLTRWVELARAANALAPAAGASDLPWGGELPPATKGVGGRSPGSTAAPTEASSTGNGDESSAAPAGAQSDDATPTDDTREAAATPGQDAAAPPRVVDLTDDQWAVLNALVMTGSPDAPNLGEARTLVNFGERKFRETLRDAQAVLGVASVPDALRLVPTLARAAAEAVAS